MLHCELLAKITIRIIAIPLKVNGQLINFEGMHEAFASAYERLVRGEPIRCAGSGVTYDPIVSPTSAILDVSMICHGLPTHTDWIVSSSLENL